VFAHRGADDSCEKVFHQLTSLGMLRYDRRKGTALAANDEALLCLFGPGGPAKRIQEARGILHTRAQRSINAVRLKSLGQSFPAALEQGAQLFRRQPPFHSGKQGAEGGVGRAREEILGTGGELIDFVGTARTRLRTLSRHQAFPLQREQMRTDGVVGEAQLESQVGDGANASLEERHDLAAAAAETGLLPRRGGRFVLHPGKIAENVVR
jgi:hypothetical protein